VGAGTHPGAGIPGVLMSAKALESVLPSAPLPSALSSPAALRPAGVGA
jgi:phytoene desaturase